MTEEYGTHRLSAGLIKAEAERLGFFACGLAEARQVDDRTAARFRQWLQRGCHAGMGYMQRHADLRLDPRRLAEGCRTVVCALLNYRPAVCLPENRLQLSWYAYGQDYHDIVRGKLHSLLTALQQRYPALTGRAFCDTAPVLERYWAWQCGLGWPGRHTQLVFPHHGSAFFIGGLLLDLPADRYDRPATPHCGTCRRCIDACPTHAIGEDGQLDARRCLSYLTIENRGAIPAEAARKMPPYFYGCDRCLRACPHLQTAPPTREAAFAPRPELLAMTDGDWMRLDVERYRRLFKGSAVKRAKYEGLVRNLQAISQSREAEPHTSENPPEMPR